MATIIRKIISLALLCLYFSPVNQAFADNQPEQFNFDDNYEGEEIAGNKNNNLVHDPFEKFNRKIFSFNEIVDKNIALPVVRQYHKIVPQMVRDSIRNFTNNISAPFSIVNSALQGDGTNSMASFSSFLINTTLGFGGLFDVAGKKKINYNEEDFGQTFGKYGSKPGPYLVIPILGPSNLRDFSGFAIEKVVDPLSLNALNIGGKKDLVNIETSISLSLANVFVLREELIDIVDDIRKNSFDPYATIRSAYSQRRESLILNK